MPHLPPAHHETSKHDSPNKTKIKEKQNETVPDSNSNLSKLLTHHNQTKELTTWFLKNFIKLNQVSLNFQSLNKILIKFENNRNRNKMKCYYFSRAHCRPWLQGLPRPGPWLDLWPAHASRRWPARTQHVVTPCGRGQSAHGGADVDGLSTAENRNKARGNESHALAIMPLYDDLGGEAGKGMLTGEADDTVEEDDTDRETSLQWRKVLQNWFPSCARGPRTLGTTWSATGSGVGVRRVELELQNLVQKHHEPLAKLGVEGIKERVARTLANRR
jgi:hypothetical protein